MRATIMLSETYLYREIFEQPDALDRLLMNEKDAVRELARTMQQRDINHVVIAARGTSDNAARYAKYVLGAVNGLTVSLATPSLFSLYERPPRFGDFLVLGISQSGKSPDIVSVLEEARRQGKVTAAITNTPGSDLAQLADLVIDLSAGEERAVAATKTYTTSLGAIAMLSAALSGDGQLYKELERLPEAMAETLDMDEEIYLIAPRYRYMQHCVVIGRGYNYATAFEIALKMKELTYTIVEPYSSADFRHGPMAMIERGFPVMVIAPTGVLLPEMLDFMLQLNERHAETIAITDDPQILKAARIPLGLPRTVPEWLSPLLTILPGQLFALYLAAARDYDVDSPRGLHKVTETR
jgi:glucosamine--fructose-6-phosphate aminotransferase (isomerizing)